MHNTKWEVNFAGMKELKSINKYFYRYKKYFVFGIVFILLTNYFRILSPQVTGYIIDEVVNNMGAGTSGANVSNYDVLVQKLIFFFNSQPFSQK